MPPQGTQNPTPEKPTSQQQPELQTQPEVKSPEVSPAPISPEAPAAEKFNDQQAAAQPQTPASAPVVEPQTVPPLQNNQLAIDEEEEASDKKEVEQVWVHAVDSVIEKDKNKPFEEEEDSEVLSQKFLDKTYGKKVEKEE